MLIADRLKSGALEQRVHDEAFGPDNGRASSAQSSAEAGSDRGEQCANAGMTDEPAFATAITGRVAVGNVGGARQQQTCP